MCKDESKWDTDVVLHRLRGHLKFQGGMEQLYNGLELKRAFEEPGLLQLLSTQSVKTSSGQSEHFCIRLSFPIVLSVCVFTEAPGTLGQVNKMSEEMLSFIVRIMHNTPAL